MAARHEASRRAVREGRRLRADDGHHRHRAGARARAAEPRRAVDARTVDLRGVHRHADGRRLGQRDLPADRQPPEGDLRRRDRAAHDDARGDPLDPGRRQPAAGLRKADVLPAARRARRRARSSTVARLDARPRRPDDGARTRPRTPPRRRGAGGEQRALAADLRRHDHAADGAVHGAVLDLLGQHLQVPDAAAVAEGRLLGQHPARRQSDRPAGRDRQRRARAQQRRTAGDRAGQDRRLEQPAEQHAARRQHRHASSSTTSTRRRRGGRANRPPPRTRRRSSRTSSASSTPTPPRTASPRACRPRSKRAAWSSGCSPTTSCSPPGRPRSKAARDALLGEIAQLLNVDDTHPIAVEGNTDNVPIHSAQFPSNWELSTARASTVVRFLIAHGVQPQPADRLRLRRTAPGRQQRHAPPGARATGASRSSCGGSTARRRRTANRRHEDTLDGRHHAQEQKAHARGRPADSPAGVGYTMTKPKPVDKEKIKGTIYVLPAALPAEPQRRPLRQARPSRSSSRPGRATAPPRRPAPRAAKTPRARCPRNRSSAKS